MNNRGLRAFCAAVFPVAGAVCLALAAILLTSSRSVVDPEAFASRTAGSLDDPRVARFVADRITSAVIAEKPDLLALRPLLLATANGIVSSEPFAVVVRRAARRAHQAIVSQGAQNLILSLPDFDVLLRGALENASPGVAAKIPNRVETTLAQIGESRQFEIVVDALRLAHRARRLGRTLLLVGVGLLALGTALAPNRIRGVARTGASLLIAGAVLAAILPLGRLGADVLSHDPLVRGALHGLWRAYLGELAMWGLFLGGLGLLFTTAASSLLDSFRPEAYAWRAMRLAVQPPGTPRRRALWGACLLAAGLVTVAYPQPVLFVVVVVAGIVAAYVGTRELFRVILETVEPLAQSHGGGSRRWVAPAVVFGVAAVLAGSWLLLRRPPIQPAAAAVAACNGHPELCDRRLDEVVFAGSHNSMSNSSITDWMFPHHQASVADQLQDGIRCLMLDVHYGLRGADRIETDLDAEHTSRERLLTVLGPEGVDAAERIRSRLVGVDSGSRGLYLCHGYCELGATDFVATLRDIHEFMVGNPQEIVILSLEDYVEPSEIVAAFAESGLDRDVYEGPSGPPWPTLGELVEGGRRLVVFTESGKPGPAWLRPLFASFQETPYTFYSPAEFNNKPNRGGTGGSLLLLNHWIQTTPNPRPSNAAIVNAYDFLLARARACQKERGHIPNVIAVDFCGTGDLFRVVDTLNGVAPPVTAAAPSPAPKRARGSTGG